MTGVQTCALPIYPFGNVVTITSPTVMTARFPGQWFQIEDGLSYNWHRNYDPTLGRYSQADPLGFVDGPGVYSYANSSPVMKVDPRGLFAAAPRPSNPEDKVCVENNIPQSIPAGSKGPTFRCEVCDAPHGGLYDSVCPDCYSKGFRPQEITPPAPKPKKVN